MVIPQILYGTKQVFDLSPYFMVSKRIIRRSGAFLFPPGAAATEGHAGLPSPDTSPQPRQGDGFDESDPWFRIHL